MATYAQGLLDDIRAGIDLVELIGRFVNLRKAGANWKGLCPFHSEKTPSFMVNPTKGIFHCFGCGVGGDAFGFLMRQDKLTFPEAVRALAKQAGVALPEERATAQDSGRDELFRAMELAARLYSEALWKPGGERAREYLERRGIDPAVARRFTLGYAPESWDFLLTALRSEGAAVETLERAGLVVPRSSGSGFYDRFRGRLIFTIRDLQGRVVAFGGRAFGDEQPKYLNSPETPLYTKGRLLYAANLARDVIREKNRALLVEGYVDCLMAHQYGFTETVAALGTAFTPMQLDLLRRYCDEVVTFFDADAAGRKAAERAEELLEPTAAGAAFAFNPAGGTAGQPSFRLKVALLAAGHDPDTFLRENGAAAFETLIAQARSLLSYALERALADPDGAAGPRARANAFARAALLLAKVADGDEAAALSREAATKLGVDPTQLWIESRRLSSALRRPSAAPAAPPPAAPAPTRDRDLVVLLLASPEARAALLPMLDESDLQPGPLRTIAQALRARPDAAAAALLSDLADESARHLLAALTVEEHAVENAPRLIEQFQQHLERLQRLRHLREVGRALADSQANADTDSIRHDELIRVHEDGRALYRIAGGVAQSLEHGTRDPQGVQRHD